jgi:hypothetical protein
MESARQTTLLLYLNGTHAITSGTCTYNKEKYLNDLVNILTVLNLLARAICLSLLKILLARLNPLCLLDLPNKKNICLLLKVQYLRTMNTLDEEIANALDK